MEWHNMGASAKSSSPAGASRPGAHASMHITRKRLQRSIKLQLSIRGSLWAPLGSHWAPNGVAIQDS